MKIFSKYDPPPSLGIECLDQTLTQEHFKQECDINFMLAQHGVLEQIPGAFYCDFQNSHDLRESLAMLQEAQSSFETLPAQVRANFSNDPIALLQFIENPDNAHRFAEFGLTNEHIGRRDSSLLDVTVTTDTSTTTKQAGDEK